MKKLFASLLLGFISLSAAALTCGEVPVYCIIKTDPVYGLNLDDPSQYYIAKRPVASLPTEYKSGFASPLCKAKVDKEALYEQCHALYPPVKGDHVVGIAYYRGGDPKNPANPHDTRMWTGFYEEVKIMDKHVKGYQGQKSSEFWHGLFLGILIS